MGDGGAEECSTHARHETEVPDEGPGDGEEGKTEDSRDIPGLLGDLSVIAADARNFKGAVPEPDEGQREAENDLVGKKLHSIRPHLKAEP